MGGLRGSHRMGADLAGVKPGGVVALRGRRPDGGASRYTAGRRTGDLHRPDCRAAADGRAASRQRDHRLHGHRRRAELVNAPADAARTCVSKRSAWRRTATAQCTRYIQVKQARLQVDPPHRRPAAIHACRNGGTDFIRGVFTGARDKFPLSAVINKGPDRTRRPAARPVLHPNTAAAHGGWCAEHLSSGHAHRDPG